MKDYIICSPENLIPGIKKDSIYVFLAGPIQSTKDEWQFSVPRIEGVTWISPRRKGIINKLSQDQWKEQFEWETKGLRISDYIIFWIPQPDSAKLIEGRDYAQTTRMELLENLSRGKTIILGIENEIHARKYMVEKAHKYGINKICSSLEECIDELKEKIKNKKDNNKTFFTSDLHFNQQRTFDLSKRPFKDLEDMNWSFIENWNNVVAPDSNVIIQGDFGDWDYLKYLNGKIDIILGNYERKEMEEKKLDMVDYNDWLTSLGISKMYLNHKYFDLNGNDFSGNVVLVHEPSNYYKYRKNNQMCLYGHCHQVKIKPWGYNVGIDCNNYFPVNEDVVAFYLNAISKYYDEETWC